MRPPRSLTLILLTWVLLPVAGCGGGAHATKPPPPVRHASQLAKPACSPPVGQGHAGGCAPHQAATPRAFSLAKLPSNSGLVCDTYAGDVITSYTALAHAVNGCVFKAYETNYHQDNGFIRSWNAFRALHKWHSAYIFLRAGDCQHEAQTFVNIVNAVGGFNQPDTGPPVVDSEVPSAAQDTACVVAKLRQLTGRNPIIYTAPGTWPGGDHAGADGWFAGYGNYSHAPCVWTCQPLAWQFTDGHYGPYPHILPGYQSPGDVSADYGVTRLVPAPPPDPYAKYPKPVRSFKVLHGVVHASEYKSVIAFDRGHCSKSKSRSCSFTRDHLSLLLGRITYLAYHRRDAHGGWHDLAKPRWDRFELGSRAAGIRARLG